MNSARERPKLKDIVGTLPDWAIFEAISTGYIAIAGLWPKWEENIGPVTIDFHLGKKVLVPKARPHGFVDVRQGVTEDWYDVLSLENGATLLLQPDQFVITETQESLTVPDDVIARLEGKSSLARLGVVVHLTAGRFDPGWNGNPVLELKNGGHNPVILYQGWPICAFSFEKLVASVEHPYQAKGRYVPNGQIHSLVHRDEGK